MSKVDTAKIFMSGRSQAVRLPKAFRFDGTEVRITRVGNGVLLEPVVAPCSFDDWLADVRAGFAPDFMADGRDQPPMPADTDFSDLDNAWETDPA